MGQLPQYSPRDIIGKHLYASVVYGKDNGMKAEWRSMGRLCLVTALCLMAWNGPSALPVKADSCAEIIVDGGFETGGAWQLGVDPVPPEYVTDPVHAGARSLALGITQGTNVSSYSSARQVVTIPAAAAEARLSFWFRAKVGDQAGADKMQLLLLNADDTVLAVLWTSGSSSPDWSQLTYDVTPWRGRPVQVYFNVINDGAGGTAAMYLDDVSLAVCSASVSAVAMNTPAAEEDTQGSTGPVLDSTPSALPDDLAEVSATALETPAMIFFTPEVDSSVSQEEAPAPATGPGTEEALSSSPDAGTPALIFFTPTADQMASQGSQLDSGTPGIPQVGGAGTQAPQLTRVALPMTPAETIMLRSTPGTGAPRAASGTPAPPTSGDAPIVRWPKGWWFGVGVVIVIILFAVLFAWRRG
jgi:hypothetical protein